MFSLPTFTKAYVRSINIRSENHGKDQVPAIDLGLRFTFSNVMLAMFEPDYPETFFKVPDGSNPSPQLDGIEPVSNLSELRLQSLKFPIKIDREYAGRNVVIDYGLGGKRNIDLSGCDFNDFDFECKQGGSVVVDCRMQVSGVKDSVIGTLGTMVKRDILLTAMSSAEADGTLEIVPPAAFRYSAKEGKTVDNTTGAPQQLDATGQFLQAHGTSTEGKQEEEAKPDSKKPVKSTPIAKKVARVAAKKARTGK